MIQKSQDEGLPPYLREAPTELDDLPLQVQLLTMELAATRISMTKAAELLRGIAAEIAAAQPRHPLAACLFAMAAAIEPAVVTVDG